MRCTFLFGVLVLSACAQTLPRQATHNAPSATGEPLDTSLVNFQDIQTGENVNLASYMKENDLQYMLLTFGSLSCGACMQKTEYLEANLVKTHQMTVAQSSEFAVRGVNVDTMSSHTALVNKVKADGLTHLAWSDPDRNNSAMMRFFQPAGLGFGVPLVVMISRSSKMWVYAKDNYISEQDLLRKVYETLGQNVEPPPPTDRPRPTIAPLSILADERADRFTALPAVACGETEPKPVSEVLDDAGLKIIIADREACAAGSVCAQNKAIVEGFLPSCVGVSCKSITLAESASVEGACDASLMRGGSDIFTTFADHFSWKYGTFFEGATQKIPTVQGPLTMIFDRSGKLVFSHEGLLTEAQLSERWQSDQLTARATGPNFALATETSSTTFSSLREGAKWTMVNFWGAGCTTCEVELVEWHHENSLMDFCKGDAQFCKAIAVEEGNFWSGSGGNPAEIPQYFIDEINPTVAKFSWVIPQYIESIPNINDQRHRWFNNWVVAKTGVVEFMAVLFDSEGKLRGFWPSLPEYEGQPLAELKRLKSQPISGSMLTRPPTTENRHDL